jgi:predicted RNase H-like nuclease (RuvC/YqgF family)
MRDMFGYLDELNELAKSLKEENASLKAEVKTLRATIEVQKSQLARMRRGKRTEH